MHSNKPELCYFIISEIWAQAKNKNIWITAFCIPGKENYEADTESFKKKTEPGMDA